MMQIIFTEYNITIRAPPLSRAEEEHGETLFKTAVKRAGQLQEKPYSNSKSGIDMLVNTWPPVAISPRKINQAIGGSLVNRRCRMDQVPEPCFPDIFCCSWIVSALVEHTRFQTSTDIG